MFVYALIITAVQLNSAKVSSGVELFETKAHCEKNISYVEEQLKEAGYDKVLVTCSKREVNKEK
jgi:hypothetical protein